MTIENTEVRIDWLDGISVERTDLKSGQVFYLESVPGATINQLAINRRIRVNSPDEIDTQVQLGDNGEWGSARALRKHEINSAGLMHKYDLMNYDPPERNVTVYEFLTWKPTAPEE